MFRSFVRNNLLFVAIGFSVAVGVGMGLAGRSFSLSPDTMSLIQFPGEIFMRLLKLMILPLVVSSLISALAQMDVKNCSKMGAITLIYYLTTVFLATILGIFLVLMIHPGDPRLSSDNATMETEKISAMDTILDLIRYGDLIRNMFPDNLIQASFERTHTVYKKSLTNQINASSQQITKEVAEQRGMNILGIIVFCVGFGIVTSHYAEKVPVIVNFFLALDKIIMKLMLSVMWFAPVGIASSICGSLLELDDIWTAASAMTMYILTVLTGLFVHSFITIPALYVMITRKNPLNIFKYMMEGGIAAMGTSSSGAALPLSINGMEQLGGMDERVARFVLPLGATINMDGCALYEAVAVIFIAQVNSVQLRFDEIITVSVTATIASLGLNAVPAGLVSILLILSTVGLPVTEVPLLFAVDWMLDRIRTSLNVFGDGFAASVVEMALRKQLKQSSIDAQENVRPRGSIA
ncbi:putative excitatory amino acid transporter 1 [Ancylostoma caninum]|uniref:Amino acid transporter n=1 Tax=Ancylostoma caninum TaxID=29170 RepID=A0A368H3K6_ANCCA|nr:putative excitatory amino acid transporter 1 [Ancylostoma caninum]